MSQLLQVMKMYILVASHNIYSTLLEYTTGSYIIHPNLLKIMGKVGSSFFFFFNFQGYQDIDRYDSELQSVSTFKNF